MKAVLDVTDTLEIQPIIASKRQSSISPASKSFSLKSKCAKIKVLSKDVEIEKEEHVHVGKIIQRERKLQTQLQCGNIILMMLLMLWAFRTCDNMQNLICQSQKKTICMWLNKLCEWPGATSTIVDCLEMIIKFANDIVTEEGLEIPARLTWMDGLLGYDSVKDTEKDMFGLKVLFLLMCTPCTKDKELQYLEEYLNSDEFSLDSGASMSVHDIASKN